LEKKLNNSWRNNYGRRKGKALRGAQKTYMASLQKYQPVGIELAENPSRKKSIYLRIPILYGLR